MRMHLPPEYNVASLGRTTWGSHVVLPRDKACVHRARSQGTRHDALPKAVGMLPTTSENTYADKIIPGNETNIHVACRAGLDQNRIPPHEYYAYWSCLPVLGFAYLVLGSRVDHA